MRLLCGVLLLISGLISAQPDTAPTDARGYALRGTHDYQQARYEDAIRDFQQAVELEPSNVTYHLHLATAFMTVFIPGADTAENLGYADRARAEFERVLGLDPGNRVALSSLASLSYQQAQGMTQREQKAGKLDEARDWYQKLIAVDPGNKEAYYSLGVIDWMKWYPALMQARMETGMRPEDPGPLRDPVVKQQLMTRYSGVIEDGISNLQKALEIDPQYDDAMAYMNLLIRERGDLRNTPEECRMDVAAADAWVQKALDTKKMKAVASAPGMRAGVFQAVAPPPPPTPSPAGSGSGGGNSHGATPQRIRIGGNVQAANLISQVEPVYPPLAKQARIQGTVRFSVIIGKDGHVLNMQLISGHPLLVAAAQEAVKQWVYRPTLLNGEPVEVVTTVDVNFGLKE